MASAPPSVVVAGEALWDGLPGGLFLGGAPCNVGVHCTQLGRRAAAATRVGRDQLGEEICDRLAARGVDTSLIQFDDKHRTGFVKVTMKGSEPTYTIVEAAAWDFIEPTEKLLAAAQAADADNTAEIAKLREKLDQLAATEAEAAAASAAVAAGSSRAVLTDALRKEYEQVTQEAQLRTAGLARDLNAAQADLGSERDQAAAQAEQVADAPVAVE
jgi:fructokinase